jgi:glycine cleavage system H protein
MPNIPSDLKYTREHEWVQSVRKGVVRVGITDFAQRQLGDVVFVELPKPPQTLGSGEPFGTVESVKAVSELYMPVAGKVTSVNEEINDSPELVNGDPYGDGWLIEIQGDGQGDLLSAKEYAAYVAEESAE